METQQAPERGNRKAPVVLLFTLAENITCVYSSGCGEYYLVNYFGKK